MKGGLVIWQQSERNELPLSIGDNDERSYYDIRALGLVFRPDSQIYQRLQGLGRCARGYIRYSPLKILLTRGFKKLENDVLLPNVAASAVVTGKLRNGDEMLFLRSEIENSRQTRTASTRLLVELNSFVVSTGNQLLVLLVPDKYRVYRSLLADPARAPESAYLSRVAADLRRANVPVLDLTEPLQIQATQGLWNHEYNYRIDDTHWNPVGVQTGVQQILIAMRQLRDGDARRPLPRGESDRDRSSQH